MCIGCALANSQRKVYSLHLSNKFHAILDHDPVSAGHILLIPLRHVEKFSELDYNEIHNMQQMIKKIQLILTKKMNITNFTLMINEGKINDLNGHLHLHIIPRYENDEVVLLESPTARKVKIEEIYKNLIEE